MYFSVLLINLNVFVLSLQHISFTFPNFFGLVLLFCFFSFLVFFLGGGGVATK